MNTKRVTVNEIQFYISNNIQLHPALSDTFTGMLFHMELHNKLTMMPSVVLQRFSDRMQNRCKVLKMAS